MTYQKTPMWTASVTILLLVVLMIGIPSASVFAVAPPSFPSCTNPQATVKVHYDNGTHGIVGDVGEYRGKDTVYQVTPDTLIQCFCSAEGNGIKTNWWKMADLSDEDINILKLDGWIVVPDGSVWGLDAGPYLAKNSTFSCNTTSSSTGNTTNGGGSSDTASSGTGGVLGAMTSRIGSVLGFAATGNILFLLLSSITGVFLLLLWIMMRKRIPEQTPISAKSKNNKK